MEVRVRNHPDHTSHNIFHHGLIKLLIVKELEKEGWTWSLVLFCSRFKVEKPEDAEEKYNLETLNKLISYNRNGMEKTHKGFEDVYAKTNSNAE